MLRREEIVKRFILGMSVLTSYIHYTGNLNMHDINISAEQFMCDLLNILYDLNLTNANNTRYNNPGYDLISEKNAVVVQVTATNTPDKIKDTFDIIDKKLNEYEEWADKIKEIRSERKRDISTYTTKVQEDEKQIMAKMMSTIDIKGYTVYFMIMRENAKSQRDYSGVKGDGYYYPYDIRFDQKEHILDFDTLVNKVNSIPEYMPGQENDLLEELYHFMNKNKCIFGWASDLVNYYKNSVDSIIKEYADNFTEKLFRHRYIEDSKVTLDRLFVDPKMNVDMDFIQILDKFLWDETEKRILFIEGDAAIGKTSLVSYLCYHYRKHDDVCRAVFLTCKLVCVRLRELDFKNKDKDVQKILLEYLGFDTMEAFKDVFGNSVLILDGADELSMIEELHNSGIEDLIVAIRKIFNNNKIIITSRPQFIDTNKLEKRNFGIKIITISHFDEVMRAKWLEKYEQCGERIPKRTKEYIMNLDDKAASGVADTPLALYLLVACDVREELQGNVWALYNEIFRNAIINTEYNENFDNSSEHPIKDYANTIDNIVCNIAFKMFKNSMDERYYITSKELDAIVDAALVDQKIVEWIRKCCVLCAYWKKNGRVGALEFYHNNIRDYFFSEYIYNRLCLLMSEDDEDKTNDFLNMMCEIMQHGYIAGTTWEQTFLFLHERLQYMNKYSNDENDLSAIANFLKSIYTKIVLTDDTIWRFNYKGYNYQKIKYTLFNTLLLIRIFQNGVVLDKLCDKTLFWSNEKEAAQILNSNILADWNEMFSRKVTISKNKIISIGQNCVLDGVIFEKRAMEGSFFDNSSLKTVNFSNTYLNRINFSDSNLTGACFSNATLKEIDFSNAILENVNFEHANLTNCIFKGATITEGKFQSTKIEECIFKDAEIKKIDWSSTKIRKCSLENTHFYNSCLERLNLKREKSVKSTFITCNLEKANMEECDIQDNEFFDCKLDGAVLIGTRFYDTKMKKSTCVGVKLSNSIIRRTQFWDVDFTDASFSHTQIGKNSWRRIKFRNSDFRQSKIYTEDIKELKNCEANLKWALEIVSLEMLSE